MVLMLVTMGGRLWRPLILAAWSGSAAASRVYKGLTEGVRLRRISPLLAEGSQGLRPVLSGVEGEPPLTLGEGRRVALTLLLEGDAGPSTVLSIAEALREWGVRIEEISVEQVRLEPPRLAPQGETVLVEARYGPTIHVFRGRRVLYPSPARLLSSAARSIGEALGRDLHGLAAELLGAFELSGHKTRTTTISIGRGRTVKAFHGKAIFIAAAERLGQILLLLEAARVFGVGKSRGIGFGHFQYKILTEEP